MPANINLVNRIAQIGARFFNEHDDTIFRGVDVNNLKVNSAASIKLFFKHMFLRGRKDSVSMQFYSDFESHFQDYFGNDDAINRKDFKYKLTEIVPFEYDNLLKEVGLNNRNDRKMILSSYKFFEELQDCNPTNYIINTPIEESFRRLDAISSIGEKLTSFYHRNLYKRLGIPEGVNGNTNFLLPIDTHIGKISFLSGITSEISNEEIRNKIEKKYKQSLSAYSFDTKKKLDKVNLNKNDLTEIKIAIIKICESNNINAMDYNQGAWCVGFYSLPMLFSLIENCEISEIDFSF